MGHKPKSTIDLMMFSGHDFETLDTAIVSSQSIARHVKELRTILSKTNQKVKIKKQSKRLANNAGRKPLDQPHIHVGDYLLLSRKRKKRSKLQFNWTGPYVAVKPLTEFI